VQNFWFRADDQTRTQNASAGDDLASSEEQIGVDVRVLEVALDLLRLSIVQLGEAGDPDLLVLGDVPLLLDLLESIELLALVLVESELDEFNELDVLRDLGQQRAAFASCSEAPSAWKLPSSPTW
jgi:hypothetical protein